MTASRKGGNKAYQPLLITLVALLLAFLCSQYVFTLFRIVGKSMEPTLMADDWTIVNLLAYQNASPSLGDMITFRKEDITDEVLVKRVIGVPYDTVEISDGELILNGSVCKEAFAILPESMNMQRIAVPADCYFVLGDHHEVSNDSSIWDNPYVRKKDLIGQVVMRIYPALEILNER